MARLLQKAARKAIAVTAYDPENNGKLVMVTGPLQAPGAEILTSPAWGVHAPRGSAALRVQVEKFTPLSRWSPRRLLCRRGSWCEASSDVCSTEVKAADVRIGGFSIADDVLSAVDTWEAFAPAGSERYEQVVGGATGGLAHTLRLQEPFPFPGEHPRALDEGAVLYYQRSGTAESPAFGDIRVRFLHLPCHDKVPFTAVGVQHGADLHAFRYRDLPPSDLSFGRADSIDFNLGTEGYAAVPDQAADDQEKGRAAGESAADTSSFPLKIRIALAALGASFEAWRRLLHRTAPEALVSVFPGRHCWCTYILMAYWAEARLTWRIRALGFSVMVTGIEIAVWKWEVALTLLAAPTGYALWVLALVGAGGFTACTVAAASVFYQPIAALLCICSAFALFAVLLGVAPILWALGAVAVCMCLLGMLMMVHLLLPC